MIKQCLICTKDFKTFASKIAQGKGKYCSRKCYEISEQGKPSWNKGKSNTWMIGNQYRKGISNPNPNILFGEVNHKWKGDEVGYTALHMWIYRKLGQPRKCEHCGNNNLKHRQYHWANKSHEYLRDIKDWIRLCASCHKKYDSKITD